MLALMLFAGCRHDVGGWAPPSILDVWLTVVESSDPSLVGEAVFVDSDGSITATLDGVRRSGEWNWDQGSLLLWSGPLKVGSVEVDFIDDCWRGAFTGLIYGGTVAHFAPDD